MTDWIDSPYDSNNGTPAPLDPEFDEFVKSIHRRYKIAKAINKLLAVLFAIIIIYVLMWVII